MGCPLSYCCELRGRPDDVESQVAARAGQNGRHCRIISSGLDCSSRRSAPRPWRRAAGTTRRGLRLQVLVQQPLEEIGREIVVREVAWRPRRTETATRAGQSDCRRSGPEAPRRPPRSTIPTRSPRWSARFPPAASSRRTPRCRRSCSPRERDVGRVIAGRVGMDRDVIERRREAHQAPQELRPGISCGLASVRLVSPPTATSASGRRSGLSGAAARKRSGTGAGRAAASRSGRGWARSRSPSA